MIRAHGRYLRPAVALGALLAGLALQELGSPYAHTWLLAWLAIAGAPIVAQTTAGILRGRFAADIVASLSIVGALVLGEPVAGLVIVLMQSGGEALELYAAGRASAAVRELERRAPHIAHRIESDTLVDIAVDAIRVGDTLLVRPGELIPCDADVAAGRSHVDASSLTGEPVPVVAAPGVRLMSGSLNQEGPLTIRARAIAGESQYARIVELVRSAEAHRAPLQRLADRYAIWFTPIVLLVCVGTWVATHDAARVLAVLVVATPCPLLLATPVAVIGGINRAARDGIIVRSGTALEQVGTVNHVVFDKTGTLTIGRPVVERAHAGPGVDRRRLLARAAAVEQGSSHLLARSIVAAFGVETPLAATDIQEEPGRGVLGTVDGSAIAVGSRAWITSLAPASAPGFDELETGTDGLRAYVLENGHPAAVIEFADRPRADVQDAIAALRHLGITRLSLVSGDAAANVAEIASHAGIVEATGDLLAEDKVQFVRQHLEAGRRVMMVGDGTNDAPALAAATVGVALAEHGGGISAEAADVIILRDDLRLVPHAIDVSRRTLRIARQSILAGLGLSAVGMVAAALGALPPTAGALVQEGIDLAVILNAIRAATDGATTAWRNDGRAVGPAPHALPPLRRSDVRPFSQKGALHA